jgi:hypothetical protein
MIHPFPSSKDFLTFVTETPGRATTVGRVAAGVIEVSMEARLP